MRIANDAQVSAIMAKSNIRRSPHAWMRNEKTARRGPDRPITAPSPRLTRQPRDLAFRQEPGSLSDQEQRTEAIQITSNMILPPGGCVRGPIRRAVPGDADECGGGVRWASMGKCWRRYKDLIRKTTDFADP